MDDKMVQVTTDDLIFALGESTIQLVQANKIIKMLDAKNKQLELLLATKNKDAEIMV